MKKMLMAPIMVLAGALVFGGSICTFAEEETETEILEMDYSMIDESVYDGEWASFFDVFDLYLPTDWTELELTEEYEEAGVVYGLVDEEAGNAILISYIDSGSAEITLDEIAEALAEKFDVVEQWNINDIPTLVFSYADDTAMGIAALGDEGGWYQVSLNSNDTKNVAWATNVICSFSAHEEAEAAQ